MLDSRFALRFVGFFLLLSLLSFAEVRRYDGPGPVEIHVHAKAKSGMGSNLEKLFREEFYPAISKQPGFRHCDLLRNPHIEGQYLLTIAFDSEDLRVKWANSPLHERIWPKMQANMEGDSIKIDALGMVATK